MPSSDQHNVDAAEATRVRRELENARKGAIESVAARNRKAHEAAVKDRRAQERFRRERNAGLYT
jgi:hypothetical protein